MLILLGKIFHSIPTWVWEFLFVLALIAGGFWNGKVQYWRGEHAQLAKEKTAQQEYAKQSQVITTKVQTVYVDRIKTVQLAGQTIVKRIPIYVTKVDDSKCTINNGFVRLWNYSNQMSVSFSPLPTDETTSAVKLSDVAAEHSREATAYQELYEQVVGLQSWIRQEQAIK